MHSQSFFFFLQYCFKFSTYRYILCILYFSSSVIWSHSLVQFALTASLCKCCEILEHNRREWVIEHAHTVCIIIIIIHSIVFILGSRVFIIEHTWKQFEFQLSLLSWLIIIEHDPYWLRSTFIAAIVIHARSSLVVRY